MSSAYIHDFMKEISSIHNPLIKETVRLHKKENAMAHNLCLVEGKRCIEAFLLSKCEVKHIFVTPEHIDWARERCSAHSIICITENVSKKLSSLSTSSGVIALFTQPSTKHPSLISDGIVLANVCNPGNMGALIRTATALDKSIIIIEGAYLYNQKVIQASAGTLAHAKIFKMSWQELLAYKKNLPLAALVAHNGTAITELDPHVPRLLIIGNEAHGLPTDWENVCDEHITLPMPGTAESLNAAIAGSIGLYYFNITSIKK